MNPTQDILSKAEISDFAKRVQLRREQLSMSKSMLAKAIGVSLTTIQLYENNQLPKAKFAIKLADALHCSLDWLLVGSHFTGKQNNDLDVSKLITVQAANACFSSETNELEIDPSIKNAYSFALDFLQSLGNPQTMLVLKAAGDSMYPQIVHNDTVLIDTSKCKLKPGGIFAIAIEGMIYIKTANAIPGKIIFSGLNSNCLPIEMSTEQDKTIKIIGEVLWIGRKLI